MQPSARIAILDVSKGERDRELVDELVKRLLRDGLAVDEALGWPAEQIARELPAVRALVILCSAGLQAFLDRVWKSVRDQVKAAIAKAIGAGLSAYLGPVIANAIGAAVAWIVDVFVGWLINLFGDDIFPIQTVSVTTPSKSARWYYPNGQWGNPSSGIRVANFYGHGGHYQVKYYWKIHG